MRDFTDIAALNDLPDGRVMVFKVNNVRIALCRKGDEVYAVQDRCTHDNGPLGGGCLDGHEVECPRHGARFDIRTGKATRMPAVFPIRNYQVSVEDGRVFVLLDKEGA